MPGENILERMEKQLDSFDSDRRRKTLEELFKQIQAGEVSFKAQKGLVNLHCHTFYSYNAYGYSPQRYAWLAKKNGLNVGGIVDFDVLDGLEGFLQAAGKLNLRGCVGMESRVYIETFSSREINSPGEPGIAYHMGLGFVKSEYHGWAGEFLAGLRKMARRRNEELMTRVNQHLKPVVLDYEKEVLPLTPAGNATERHLCSAYARKARAMFADRDELKSFWAQKLGVDPATLEMPEGVGLLNQIRAKTMKRGGVGYVNPDQGSFPTLADLNRFSRQAGAIPTMAWLDGASQGEQEMDQLMDLMIADGVEAINIVPDRNFTPGVKNQKLTNLYQVVQMARERDMPIFVGTEMNSPGQKFVDLFESEELAPLREDFLKGAYIACGHTILQQQCGLGYTSQWAKKHFSKRTQKNEFYEQLGRQLEPVKANVLKHFETGSSPASILKEIQS